MSLVEQYAIKNIINYIRKSRQDLDRERKTGEDTLHEQKQLMDRVLAGYGVPYDQRLEIGSGDKIETRPVFKEIVNELQIGKFDAIAVKEISRMGRGSYADMGLIYDLIQEKRIYIITPHRIYDPSNPSDLRMIRFELFMSREEFETTRERLMGGRSNAAMEGKWVSGHAPFGYKYNKRTKRLDIDEEKAEIVRKIFDFYANGIIIGGERKLVQFRALATYMKRIGMKTPLGKDEWHPTALRRFLENDRYIGTLRFRTTMLTSDGKQVPRPKSEHILVEDAHPAIIDPETWERVQNRINNREAALPTKMDFSPCELAGLIICAKCGRKMVRQYSVQHYKKQDGTTTIYHKEFLNCMTAGCTIVKYRNVEEDLLETLRQLKDLDNEQLKQFTTAAAKKEKKKDENIDDLTKQIEIKREALKRRLEFVYKKYEDEIYSDEEFKQRRDEIKKELNDLDSISVIKQNTVEDIQQVDPEEVKHNIASYLEMYEAAQDKTEKNEIFRSIFEKAEVEILEKGRGRKQAVHKIRPHFKSKLFFTK